MGRKYTVTFEAQSVSAAQDLFQIKGAANKVLRILRQRLDAADPTLPAPQLLQLRARVLPPTVTDGSGGGSATIGQTPSDAAPSFTALRNSTTKATTGGTAQVKFEGGSHIFTGHEFMYDDPPEIPPTSSFVFELLAAPAAAVLMSALIEVEELG